MIGSILTTQKQSMNVNASDEYLDGLGNCSTNKIYLIEMQQI